MGVRERLALAEYLTPHRHRVGYVGWLGHGNLGDEAMYHAIRDRLEGIRLLPFRETAKVRRVEALRGGRGLFTSVMLGGGTLINARGALQSMRYALDRYGHATMFGTGVLDPEYWDHAPGGGNLLGEWAEVLSALEPRTVRGPISRDILASVGVDAEWIGDPALLLADPVPRPLADAVRVGVSVGVSDAGIWGGNVQGLADWTVRLVDTLTREGWAVTLFAVWDRDVAMVRDIARRARVTPPVVDVHDSVEAFRDAVGRCRVFVGMKLHSVVLAHCAHVPSLMLEYRPKCRDHMASLGQEDFVIRTDRLDLDEAMDRIHFLSDRGWDVHADLVRRIASLRARQREVLSVLGKQLRGRRYPRVEASSSDALQSSLEEAKPRRNHTGRAPAS